MYLFPIHNNIADKAERGKVIESLPMKYKIILGTHRKETSASKSVFRNTLV